MVDGSTDTPLYVNTDGALAVDEQGTPLEYCVVDDTFIIEHSGNYGPCLMLCERLQE
ncbi:hypothetical protein KKF84_04390 [Myxococcota bacterium]|nr:hypothetical protein [Myxococcota bacterium]MBU1534534.1 hypothetical protein [Myxococcota bacterium]